MKKVLFISTLLILSLFSASSAQEKTTPQSKRLAFVNTQKFEDPNGGVEKLVKALNSPVIGGFRPETNEAKRKEAAENRQKAIIEPVRKDISDLLRQIETQNNIIILDVAALDRNGQIILVSGALDVSYQVISILNEYFKTNKQPNLNLNPANGKFAAIRTKSLTDENSGIKGINEKIRETKDFLRTQTGNEPTIEEVKEYLLKNRARNGYFFRLLDFMQTYAEKNEFNVVFDSSRKLPAELQNFQIQDITKDFISYYNQLNP